MCLVQFKLERILKKIDLPCLEAVNIGFNKGGPIDKKIQFSTSIEMNSNNSGPIIKRARRCNSLKSVF